MWISRLDRSHSRLQNPQRNWRHAYESVGPGSVQGTDRRDAWHELPFPLSKEAVQEAIHHDSKAVMGGYTATCEGSLFSPTPPSPHLRDTSQRGRGFGPFRHINVATGRCTGLQTLESSHAQHEA